MAGYRRGPYLPLHPNDPYFQAGWEPAPVPVPVPAPLPQPEPVIAPAPQGVELNPAEDPFEDEPDVEDTGEVVDVTEPQIPSPPRRTIFEHGSTSNARVPYITQENTAAYLMGLHSSHTAHNLAINELRAQLAHANFQMNEMRRQIRQESRERRMMENEQQELRRHVRDAFGLSASTAHRVDDLEVATAMAAARTISARPDAGESSGRFGGQYPDRNRAPRH